MKRTSISTCNLLLPSKHQILSYWLSPIHSDNWSVNQWISYSMNRSINLSKKWLIGGTYIIVAETPTFWLWSKLHSLYITKKFYGKCFKIRINQYHLAYIQQPLTDIAIAAKSHFSAVDHLQRSTTEPDVIMGSWPRYGWSEFVVKSKYYKFIFFFPVQECWHFLSWFRICLRFQFVNMSR